MEFKVTKRRTDGISVVELAGKITAGEALVAFRQAIRDEVAKGHNRILVNLGELSYIDSSGLGELVMALGTVTQTICGSCGATVFKNEDGNWEKCPRCRSKERKSWGQLKLANPGRQVTDLLQFTKLYTVFDVHQSEAEAMSSFTE